MKNSNISTAAQLTNFQENPMYDNFLPKKANKLKLHKHRIEEKNYIKYLGIYIDKNLKWAPLHIQHIYRKISNNVEILPK